MSELLGVKRTTYASWETKVIPDVISLIKLGEIFSLDWTSLVKDTIAFEATGPDMTTADKIEAHAKELIKLAAKLREGKL